MDRIDRKQTELRVGGTVLFGGHVSAPFADRQLDLQLYVRIEPADHQIGIQHLKVRKKIRNVPGREFGLAGYADPHLFTVGTFDGFNETYLFEIQNDLKHSFHNTGDSSKFMVYAGHFHRRDRIPFQRRKKNAAQCVADRHPESRFQRTKFKPSERRGGFEHDYLFRFLKC